MSSSGVLSKQGIHRDFSSLSVIQMMIFCAVHVYSAVQIFVVINPCSCGEGEYFCLFLNMADPWARLSPSPAGSFSAGLVCPLRCPPGALARAQKSPLSECWVQQWSPAWGFDLVMLMQVQHYFYKPDRLWDLLSSLNSAIYFHHWILMLLYLHTRFPPKFEANWKRIVHPPSARSEICS